MPQPFDYSTRTPNIDPTAHFLQGLQVVQQMEQQKAAQQQAQERQKIMTRLMALGKNATADDYLEASLALPQDAQMFKQQWDMLEGTKKDAMFKGASEAYMLAGTDTKKAIQRLEEYAVGFENAGDDQAAQQFRTAAEIAKVDPQAAKATIGMMLSFADGERFKNVAGAGDSTTFQKDFAFIKDTFGDDAAAEFAQFGRDSTVSIPLGQGQTYVGPASLAPGAARWQAKGTPEKPVQSAVDIGTKAQDEGVITQAEADVVRQSLGPKGQAKFEQWLGRNKIKVIARTGTAPNGRRVVEYTDGTVEYAD
jgi:uncharacterized protein YjgD (DUF1641 family)